MAIVVEVVTQVLNVRLTRLTRPVNPAAIIMFLLESVEAPIHPGLASETQYLAASQWDSSHSSNAGGENHDMDAPSSWCRMLMVDYPCGTHWALVHINKPKWDDTTAAGRRRLIMHETGHSEGLAHHCSSDSIMNDGTSSCNGGAWLNVTGYLATDRSGIVAICPCWVCP